MGSLGLMGTYISPGHKQEPVHCWLYWWYHLWDCTLLPKEEEWDIFIIQKGWGIYWDPNEKSHQSIMVWLRGRIPIKRDDYQDDKALYMRIEYMTLHLKIALLNVGMQTWAKLARALLLTSGLPGNLWEETMCHSVWLQNKTPAHAFNGNPHVRRGTRRNLTLWVFRNSVLPHMSKHEHQKTWIPSTDWMLG